jgi:hypothetical protein
MCSSYFCLKWLFSSVSLLMSSIQLFLFHENSSLLCSEAFSVKLMKLATSTASSNSWSSPIGLVHFLSGVSVVSKFLSNLVLLSGLVDSVMGCLWTVCEETERDVFLKKKCFYRKFEAKYVDWTQDYLFSRIKKPVDLEYKLLLHVMNFSVHECIFFPFQWIFWVRIAFEICWQTRLVKFCNELWRL